MIVRKGFPFPKNCSRDTRVSTGNAEQRNTRLSDGEGMKHTADHGLRAYEPGVIVNSIAKHRSCSTSGLAFAERH
jgi:hypothetical protein